MSLWLVARLQEARLAVLKDLLRQREEAEKEVTTERLNQVRSKKQRDKETKLQRIHKDYITCKESPSLQEDLL